MEAEGREFTIDCESAAFHPATGADTTCPPEEFREWVHHAVAVGQMRRMEAHLREFDGATLQWWKLSPSHSYLGLLATGLPRGLAELRLPGTDYLEIAETMRDVRLRLASAAETEALKARLKSREIALLEEKGSESRWLVIECDEGPCYVLCALMSIRWLEEPDTRLLPRFDGPLWDGGPLLAEL